MPKLIRESTVSKVMAIAKKIELLTKKVDLDEDYPIAEIVYAVLRLHGPAKQRTIEIEGRYGSVPIMDSRILKLANELAAAIGSIPSLPDSRLHIKLGNEFGLGVHEAGDELSFWPNWNSFP